MLRLLSLTLLSLSIIACQSPVAPEKQEEKLPDHHAEKQRTEEQAEAHESAHHHALTDAPALKLNNGQKWTANPETSAAIEVLDEHLDMFLLKDEHTMEEYRALGKQMLSDYNEVFAVCTMTGEAHEQLHNYLVPVGTMIEVLNTGNEEACEDVLEPLHRHLHVFAVYFN